jgi:hypothetical protein
MALALFIHMEVNMHVAWQTELAVYRKGGMNIYGESKYQFVRSTKVGVVNFTEESFSRRYELIAQSVAKLTLRRSMLLIVPLADVKLDDVLVMSGTKLLVASVERRWGLRGRPGHLEVGAGMGLSYDASRLRRQANSLDQRQKRLSAICFAIWRRWRK